MSKTIRKCRVCGKDYEYCHTFKVSTEFRWQNVSCSPECGDIYLKRLIESRAEPSSTLNKNENLEDSNQPSEISIEDSDRTSSDFVEPDESFWELYDDFDEDEYYSEFDDEEECLGE